MKVLWLSPNFNHYKARFLNHLAKEEEINLTILSGTGRKGMGDQEIEGQFSFNQIQLNVNKQDFGKSAIVRKEIKDCFNNYDWILIPAEKKNLLLFIYTLYLKRSSKNKGTRLVSYNHPVLKSKNGKITLQDKVITRFYNNQLDRVIFYTKESSKWAIENKFIHSGKAFWANNTIDTLEVKKYYAFELPFQESPAILFIGRLIHSKRLHDLLKYYKALKKQLPHLKLEIIGDGPEGLTAALAAKEDTNITFHGIVVDEEKISKIMRKSTMVFIPGLSGLSINHAFAYGRPYITLKSENHGPEISYLQNGKNGYILNNSFEENIAKLVELITNNEVLVRFCENAKKKGEELSIGNWVNQMKLSFLLNE